jgi:hypothetical protein
LLVSFRLIRQQKKESGACEKWEPKLNHLLLKGKHV